MNFGKTGDIFTGGSHWGMPDSINSDGRLRDTLQSLFAKRIPLWKRSIDIVASICGIVLFLPIFLIIGIYIKSVSPGPVFFRQKRVGRGGRIFTCLKFRTMTLNADTTIHREYLEELIRSSKNDSRSGEPMEKLANDSRIIKYGSILRSSGLDELPQLFNVLMGQMSIVGPRPPVPYEVNKYRLWYEGRFDVTPGITGLWQVSGKNKLGFNEMIRLDIKYAKRLSFWLDVKIILLTPFAIYQQLRNLKKKPC